MAAQIATRDALSSRVPRPQTAPSWTSAPNGGCCHGAESSTGTTSWWAISTTGRSELRPGQRNSRPWTPTSTLSRRVCSSGKRRASSAWSRSNGPAATASSSGEDTVGSRTSARKASTGSATSAYSSGRARTVGSLPMGAR